LDTQCGGGKLTHQSATNGHLILEKDVMGTLTARMFAALGARDVEEGALHAVAFDAYNQQTTGNVSKPVAARSDQDTASVIAFGAAPLNTQLGLRGPHTSNSPREGLGVGNIGDPAYTIQAAHSHAVIAFGAQNSAAQGDSVSTEVTPTLDKSKTPAVAQASAVRRLTPVECERLQGFPDDYTQIPWRNKPAENCPDGPRYKAMGNSMAVPVMRWLGERISMVDAL